ncbi:FAD-binding oxidoreductase [Jannaschia sp. Os4]|uniref:NAD(P)/FAD-dependent oxidoreductase n=1 Tax=Jannaschia sp. Os4 TaxID=2807617 RepID=UPI001939CFB4|nr:FAD-binding oxidoreductase [Jannaschia sp. Os4]MBM2576097.1 FAD-binding oxidoreductase [Jannaschia sp. Os4]
MTSPLHANGERHAYPASLYAATNEALPPFPRLETRREADLCVIGGGITGLSCALHAAQAGLSVVLLEAHRLGWGASGRNGGQVQSGFNWAHARLARTLGPKTAAALAALAAEAVALTRDLAHAHADGAGWAPGIVHACRTEAALHRAAAAEPDAPRLDRAALAARIGTDHYAGGLLDEGAACMDPLAYTLGLARACRAAGVALHERSEVHRIRPDKPHEAATGQGAVRARTLVHATNGYSPWLVPQAAARVLPLNNYIAATPPGVWAMPREGAVGFSDDRTVVHYVRQDAEGRLIFGGGESYGRRFPRDIRALVRRNLARTYPHLRDVDLPHAWGGTLAVTASRLPWVAEPAPGLWSVGGYSGHGLALAGLVGKALAAAATGDRTAADTLARLPVPALPGGRWLGALAVNVGMAWGAVRDRV